ncbi:cobyrinate a,c-diamide synthase [Acetobacteraceae bacterium H6797]|nr:cobyrinate a,c-diamide synthase [Acetobacteraceae bacterium H6797]
MSAQGLIIGAPRSGSGKTSITIGLMRAFRRRGLVVHGAKSGPDYIDPGFHAAATGHPGVNLDSWAMPPALLAHLVARQAQGADLLVIESAMGLFDGIPAPPGRSGAAADLARLHGLPVLLVLDVSGQSQTAAAIARGFALHDPAVRIGGVVLNQVASPRHEAMTRGAIEAMGMPVLGAVYRNPAMALPERHLGLVQASEHAALESFIETLADIMQSALDLDAIHRLASPLTIAAEGAIAIPPPGQRIAIAQDAAFTFLYPHLLRQWREAGAELLPFSPLADEGPAGDADACWLPGGYPELHAGRIAAAETFRAAMHTFPGPIHGECGGHMVLGETLEDAAGVKHRMTGLLGHANSFAKRRMNLGYREALLQDDGPLGRKGERLRGHEFHYAVTTAPGSDEAFATLFDGQGKALGPAGARRGRVSGTFFHAIAKA